MMRVLHPRRVTHGAQHAAARETTCRPYGHLPSSGVAVVRETSEGEIASSQLDRPWLPGLAHVLAALCIWPAFGMGACIAGLLVATLASFVVYLPLTALALNGGQPIAADGPAPALTPRAQTVMLALWTATTWLAGMGYGGVSGG
jgi:hypothetical protein